MSLVINVTASPYSANSAGTADATAAVQSAVNAAIATPNSAVYFPPGTYRIDGSVTVTNASGLTVYGDPGTVTLQSPTGASDEQLRVVSSARIRVAGLRFRGSNVSPGFALSFENTSEVGVEGCRFENTRALFLGAGTVRAVVSSCTFDDTAQAAVTIGGTYPTAVGDNSTPEARDILITLCGFNNTRGEAIDVNHNASRIRIVGNSFVDVHREAAPGGTSAEAIDIGSGGTPVRDVVITNNLFSFSGAAATNAVVAIRLKQTTTTFLISENLFAGLAGAGSSNIFIEGSCQRGAVKGNVIDGGARGVNTSGTRIAIVANSFIGLTNYAIGSFGGRCTIVGNVIDACLQGVQTRGPGNTVVGNSILDGTGPSQFGLVVQDPTDGAAVVGNSIMDTRAGAARTMGGALLIQSNVANSVVRDNVARNTVGAATSGWANLSNSLGVQGDQVTT